MVLRAMKYADSGTRDCGTSSRFVEPALIRLTYANAVVVAVVEPIGGAEGDLVIQYTVDDGRPNADVWTALLRFDANVRDWTVEVPAKDWSNAAVIAAVCEDLLRSLNESEDAFTGRR